MHCRAAPPFARETIGADGNSSAAVGDLVGDGAAQLARIDQWFYRGRADPGRGSRAARRQAAIFLEMASSQLPHHFLVTGEHSARLQGGPGAAAGRDGGAEALLCRGGQRLTDFLHGRAHARRGEARGDLTQDIEHLPAVEFNGDGHDFSVDGL